MNTPNTQIVAHRTITFFTILFFVLFFFCKIHPVSAATITWTGAGADNNWSTCANWGGTCPTSADTVTFNGTSTKDSTVDTAFDGTIAVLNISSGYTGTVSLARSLTMTSTMTQATGNFTASTNELTVTSTFTLSNGIFTAPSTTLYAKGNFAHTGGTFNHNSGTVNLNGHNQTISGSTTFYNLTKANNTFILTFSAGTTQTILNTLNFSGKTPLTPLYLRSSSAGVYWNLDAQGATRTITNIDIKDSNNLNSVSIPTDTGSKDAGHNSGWTFPGYQLPIKVIDMADSNNWHIRFDGPGLNAYMAEGAVQTADLYGTGQQDIIASAPCSSANGISTSGSIYVIAHSLYSQLIGKGNTVDLNDPASYSLRIDGPMTIASCWQYYGLAGFGSLKATNIGGNSAADLIFSLSRATYNGRTNSGSVYVLYNELIREKTVTPTGNILFLGHQDETNHFDNFSLRFDAPIPNSPVQGVTLTPSYTRLGLYVGVGNISSSSGPDVVISANMTGYNGYLSGSMYIIGGQLISNWTGSGNTIDLNESTSYTLRLDGAHAYASMMGYYMSDGIGDLDSDGKDDLVIGLSNIDDTKRYPSYIGGIYIVYNTAIASKLTGTGNSIDLGDPTNPGYSLLISTGAIYDLLGWCGPVNITDLNHDGKKWLIITSYFASAGDKFRNGSIYLIPYSILSKYQGKGNAVDLKDPSNYYLRIDGEDDNHWLGDMFTTVQDYFGLGKMDLLTGGPKMPSEDDATYGPSDWGWVYVLSNRRLNNQPKTTGNIMNVSNFDLLYQGAPTAPNTTTGTHLIAPMTDAPVNVDLNGDGSQDMLFAAHFAEYKNGAKSGALYVIYNFPHTLTATGSGNKITGTVSAPNSPTAISKVQYNVDDNSPTSTKWKNCSGTTTYSCTVSGLGAGNHTIYIRAQDTNGVYTVKTVYKSVKVSVAAVSNSYSYTTQDSSTVTPTISESPTPSSTTIISQTAVPTANEEAQRNRGPSYTTYATIICGTTVLIIILFWYLLFTKKRREQQQQE